MEIVFLLVFMLAFIWFVNKFVYRKRAERNFARQASKLTQDKVVDQWSALIDGAKGQGGKIIENVERAVRGENLPNVVVSTREVKTEDGEARQFLSISNTRLKGYDMLVAAYDYGSRLDVVWYLTFDSPWAQLKRKQARAAPQKPKRYLNQWTQMVGESQAESRKSNVEGGYAAASQRQGYRDPEVMTMSEKQELNNFVGITHDVLKREVKTMMDGLNLDFTKVDFKTRGLINIS